MLCILCWYILECIMFISTFTISCIKSLLFLIDLRIFSCFALCLPFSVLRVVFITGPCLAGFNIRNETEDSFQKLEHKMNLFSTAVIICIHFRMDFRRNFCVLVLFAWKEIRNFYGKMLSISFIRDKFLNHKFPFDFVIQLLNLLYILNLMHLYFVKLVDANLYIICLMILDFWPFWLVC